MIRQRTPAGRDDGRDPRVGQSLLQHLATHQAAGTHQQQAATLILQLPPGHAQAVATATA